MSIIDKLFKPKPRLLDGYNEVIRWIYDNTIPGEGVAITNKDWVPYPEVTGYLIPSLLNFGHFDLAEQYCKGLLSIQAPRGYWLGSDGVPSFFDTGQVLRGLLAMRERYQFTGQNVYHIDDAMLHAVYWMADQIRQDGRVIVQNKEVFQFAPGEYAPDGIMLYALEPMFRAVDVLERDALIRKIEDAWAYYVLSVETYLPTLDHYSNYIAEVLLDAGAVVSWTTHVTWSCKSGWENGRLQVDPPSHITIPGYYQGVVVDAKRGLRTRLEYKGLTGGNRIYFPNRELSWSAKFFLDALNWQMRKAFVPDAQHPPFIDNDDPRLKALRREVVGPHLLDAGAGTGRYAVKIREDSPGINIECCDISDAMVKETGKRNFPSSQCSLMNLSYKNGQFDSVYCIEALEHAVNKEAAIAELCRVTRPLGKIIIIDKSENTATKMHLAPWEEWPDSRQVYLELRKACPEVRTEQIDENFMMWVGEKE